jgi:phospholipid transport system substrate-binding protein
MGLRKNLAVIVFVAILGFGDSGRASVDGAAQFIYTLGNQAISTLQASNLTLEQREAHFRGLLAQGFDLRFIGRFVLGKHWRAATPDEKNDYLSLFSEYVLQTYSSRLGGYSGQTLTVIGARQASEKDIVVQTQIDRPSGPPILAEWRVRANGEQYRIIDVAVEGISMAVTQRAEFGAVVQRNGIPGLLTALRARTTKISATASLN